MTVNCRPSIFCCPLIDFPNLDWNSKLDSDNGAAILFEKSTFCKTSSTIGTVTKDLFALHFALPKPQTPKPKARSQSPSSSSQSTLTGACQIWCPKWSRALAFHHMLCRYERNRQTEIHLARVLYKFVKFSKEAPRARCGATHSDEKNLLPSLREIGVQVWRLIDRKRPSSAPKRETNCENCVN